MQNSPDFQFTAGKDLFRTLRCEVANAYQPLRFKHPREFTQMPVASGEQRGLLSDGQFVGCEISSAAFQKSQRAIIHYQMIAKEFFRRAKTLRKESPQSPPDGFRTPAAKSRHWTLRMFQPRFADPRVGAEPVAHRRDFAKRHARL